MQEIEVLRILKGAFNTFWNNGNLPKNLVKSFRRRDFYALIDELETDKITTIIGPRRVGKTTIMFQLIDYLLKEKKVDPKRILYISLDNAYLERVTDEIIKDAVETYVKNIVKEPINKLTERVYVFLDEIQYVKNWPRKLKTWYDYKYKIKFILSGSSSTFIRKGSSPLVGRMTERVILPMKFVDVLNYYGNRKYNTIAIELRKSFKESLDSGDMKKFWKKLEAVQKEFVGNEDEIKIILEKYMIKGGYPELLEQDDYSSCVNELKDSILSKSILDIVERHGLRNIHVLRDMLSIIALKSGSRITYSSISENLGIERPTLINHLNYLEDAFIISKSVYYTKSRMKRARKEKKYYVSDVGIRNSIVGMLNEMLLQIPNELGIVVETIVFDHVRRLKFYLSGYESIDLFFWQQKKKEVDIIIDYKKTSIPIEVKYREVSEKDTHNLKEFIEEENPVLGIIVNPDRLKREKNIFYIPLWMFLLMC